MNVYFKDSKTKEIIHVTHCDFKPIKGDEIELFKKRYTVESTCIIFGEAINKIEVELTL